MSKRSEDFLFSPHFITGKDGPRDPLMSARRYDPETSKRAAKINQRKRRTYKDRLLLVFDDALPVHHSGRLIEIALNAFEASAIAKLPPESCWWKRVSDLKESGCICAIGLRADPRTGSNREAYIITDKGRELAAQIKNK
jgi:hypothetical protein